MFPVQISEINDIPLQRIRAAIERAGTAFWAAIGQAFPKVTSGEVGPGG